MITIEDFFGRKICIGGIGKLFYQEGYPISMSVAEMRKKDVEVSILHVADECLKNGWPPYTTYTKIKADFADIHEPLDFEELKRFCEASYEDQREMIFQYLFGVSSRDVLEGKDNRPKDWFFTRVLGEHVEKELVKQGYKVQRLL